MKYADATQRLSDYRKQIAALRGEMRKVQSEIEPQSVEDYALATPEGEKRLSQLLGGKGDLIVIHNMGASCPYCTLWADGFNGVYDHLADRASFVIVSPGAPAAQQKFASGRGWKFPMASHAGTSFAADMGYRSPEGRWRPGVSTFKRKGGKIVRVSDTAMGPGDDFCSVWHFFDLLPDGANGWQPKFKYAR
jgi:predicted dithiol-disulfide oxidoreductase (DUF899 family)